MAANHRQRTNENVSSNELGIGRGLSLCVWYICASAAAQPNSWTSCKHFAYSERLFESILWPCGDMNRIIDTTRTTSVTWTRRLIATVKSATETPGLSVLFATLCIIDLFGVFPIIALPGALISCGTMQSGKRVPLLTIRSGNKTQKCLAH